MRWVIFHNWLIRIILARFHFTDWNLFKITMRLDVWWNGHQTNILSGMWEAHWVGTAFDCCLTFRYCYFLCSSSYTIAFNYKGSVEELYRWIMYGFQVVLNNKRAIVPEFQANVKCWVHFLWSQILIFTVRSITLGWVFCREWNHLKLINTTSTLIKKLDMLTWLMHR